MVVMSIGCNGKHSGNVTKINFFKLTVALNEVLENVILEIVIFIRTSYLGVIFLREKEMFVITNAASK